MADSHLDTLGYRELLAEEQVTVDRERYEQQPDHELPAQSPDVHHQITEDRTSHDAGGPPEVEAVKHLYLAVRVGAGDERVADRFDHAVAEAHEHGCGKQRFEIRRHQRRDDAGEVQQECEQHPPAHAEKVDDRAADDHRERESPERRHERVADLFESEADAFGPEHRLEARTKGKCHCGEH